VGSVYAKIRRGGAPDHISYAFQRSTTPPGSSSSNELPGPSGAGDVSPAGASHSTKAGSRAGLGSDANRRFQFTNVLRESFARRQNADSESPLAS
jgi:hypothetical protein